MLKRLRQKLRRACSREEGISTLEWVGLTAVVLVFITAALLFAQTMGWPSLMRTVTGRMDCQVRVWDSGGTCGGWESSSAGRPPEPIDEIELQVPDGTTIIISGITYEFDPDTGTYTIRGECQR